MNSMKRGGGGDDDVDQSLLEEEGAEAKVLFTRTVLPCPGHFICWSVLFRSRLLLRVLMPPWPLGVFSLCFRSARLTRRLCSQRQVPDQSQQEAHHGGHRYGFLALPLR